MTTKREDQMIVKMSLKDRFDTCRKPLISTKNQKVYLDFTTEHIQWTEEQWNMVYFSDEYKFNLFASDSKRLIRHKIRERLSSHCFKKIMKFGGGE